MHDSKERGGVSSRNDLYMHATEIYTALEQSYGGNSEGLLYFNLSLVKERLRQAYGSELMQSQGLTEAIPSSPESDHQQRNQVLALTGWVCRQV